MEFDNQFDIIVGDLAIGNVPKEYLDKFIYKVSKALKNGGLFLGKSFFKPKDYKIISPEELVKNFYNGPQYHPYSALCFDLTMYCLDKDNNLNFKKQYEELKKLEEKGILKKETMAYFENLGWDSEMKFLFHCPNVEDYKKLLNKYMHIEEIEYGEDVYSKNFPLFIVRK